MAPSSILPNVSVDDLENVSLCFQIPQSFRLLSASVAKYSNQSGTVATISDSYSFFHFSYPPLLPIISKTPDQLTSHCVTSEETDL